MNRAIRFALGIYSPSAVAAGTEPMPAPTLAGRWRQWRKLRAGWTPMDDYDPEAHRMTPEEFMETCHRSARTLYLFDDPADYDYGEEDDDD